MYVYYIYTLLLDSILDTLNDNLERFRGACFRHPFCKAVDASVDLVRFWVLSAVKVILGGLTQSTAHGSSAR